MNAKCSVKSGDKGIVGVADNFQSYMRCVGGKKIEETSSFQKEGWVVFKVGENDLMSSEGGGSRIFIPSRGW